MVASALKNITSCPGEHSGAVKFRLLSFPLVCSIQNEDVYWLEALVV